LNFFFGFWKILTYQISTGRQTGGQMDRQTEMMKLRDAFHSSVNAPNKQVKDHLVQV